MEYVGVGTGPAIRVGIVLDGNDSLGGVTSWAHDMALNNDYRVVALLISANGERNDDNVSIDRSRFAEVIDITLPPESDACFPECFLCCAADFSEVVDAIKNRIDILIPNHLEYGYKLAAAALCVNMNLRVVGICHTDESYYYHLVNKYRGIISAVVAVSAAIYQRLKTGFTASVPRLFLLPYGLPMPPLVLARRSAREFTVVYVGRLVERQKKVSRLPGVAKAVERMGVRLAWRVVGEGEERGRLVAGMPRSTVFTGALPRPDVFRELLGADALILVSEAEGTPLAMLEAMACGAVVVAPAISGIGDVIRHGENGLLFPPGQLRVAASQLAALACRPDVRRRLAGNAAVECRAGYGLAAYLASFLRLLEHVGHDKAPDCANARTALLAQDAMYWASELSVCADLGMGDNPAVTGLSGGTI